VNGQVQGAPAGLATRTAAGVIDFVGVVVFVGGGYLVVSGVKFLLNPQRFTSPAPPFAVMVTIAGVLLGAYFTVCWATSGRTYGDLVLGVRVVGRGGRQMRPAVALARAVVYLALPLGLLVAGVDRRRRSLQDMLVHSSVVYDWSEV